MPKGQKCTPQTPQSLPGVRPYYLFSHVQSFSPQVWVLPLGPALHEALHLHLGSSSAWQSLSALLHAAAVSSSHLTSGHEQPAKAVPPLPPIPTRKTTTNV